MSTNHHHAPAEFNRAFAIGSALNTGLVSLITAPLIAVSSFEKLSSL